MSLTGFYLYNRTDEPDANYFEVGLERRDALRRSQRLPAEAAAADPGAQQQLGASVMTQCSRCVSGWTRFPDNSTMTIDFDPSTLGFSPTFLGLVDQTGGPKFPNGSISGYSSFGAITPSFRTYKSWSTNASYSKLVGRHTFKFGGDFRQIGVDFLSTGDSTGRFQFDKEFTSATGLNNSSLVDGNGFASFLLGYPVGELGAAEHDDADDAARDCRELLRRLRPGRLAGELEADAELRPAHRARRRHERSRQQLHRRIRLRWRPTRSQR